MKKCKHGILCDDTLTCTKCADEWKLALYSLTPGGSEFIDDIPKCVETIKESKNILMRFLRKVIKTRRELEYELEQCKMALEDK